MKIKHLVTAAFLSTITLSSVKADEGMWLLQLLEQQHSIDLMKKQGLKLESSDIYSTSGISLKDAVGIFGGGCTGEIISPDGLILTNHHCGFGAIQQHSSVEHDYLTNGFWAKSRSEELPTPGLLFRFVDQIIDITDEVNQDIAKGVVTEMDAIARPYLRKIAEKHLNESELKGKAGIVAQALPYYAGNKFYLVYYKVYSDVRMVAAPPQSIGKFGGETDNWMWPRHTCDFSMFRIYADSNGEPAEYSPNNVPLKTPKYLTISLKGLNEGDYAMIMGFPGSTSRYLTESEVKERMQATNQARIDIRGVRLAVLKQAMAASDKTRIQYASKYAGSSNYWKNSIGMNKAILDNKVLETKAEQEKAFADFAKNKPEYANVVDQINSIIANRMPSYRQYYYLSEALNGAIEFGSPYLVMANIKQALQQKNDSLLTSSLKQLKEVYESIHNKDYDHEVDRQVAKAILPALAQALNESELPAFYKTIQTKYKGNYDAFVDDMYDNSILSNEKNFNRFLKSPKVKSIDNDPATAYSRTKNELLQAVSKSYTEKTANLELLHKKYIRGLNEMKTTPSYPDANFTLRLTYGNVKSYNPKDGVHYKYYTTGDGVLEKEDASNPEFFVPAALKELLEKRDFGRYAMKDGSLPACFLTTNDITGGNSGSPVLNAEGHLIGAAFDGNWESLSGDINFDNNLQRCIAVDIRYILFILEKLGHCQQLIDEMTIVE